MGRRGAGVVVPAVLEGCWDITQEEQMGMPRRRSWLHVGNYKFHRRVMAKLGDQEKTQVW